MTDLLANLEAWFAQQAGPLRREGIQAEISRSPADRNKVSVWIDLAGEERLGQLILWDDGAVALSVADVESGEMLTQEDLTVSSRSAVTDAAGALVRWIRTGRN